MRSTIAVLLSTARRPHRVHLSDRPECHRSDRRRNRNVRRSAPSKVTREQLDDADPCGFLDNATLTALGEIDFEDGVFYTDCTAAIDAPGNALRVRARCQLETSGRDAGDPWEETGRRGFTVWTATEQSYGCEREIQAYDDAVVALWASETETSGTICDIADKATDAAIEQLLSGEVAPHEVPPDSLFNQDACALVTDADAARAPEIDATDLHPAFARPVLQLGRGGHHPAGTVRVVHPRRAARGGRPRRDGDRDRRPSRGRHAGAAGRGTVDRPSLPSCEVEVVYDASRRRPGRDPHRQHPQQRRPGGELSTRDRAGDEGDGRAARRVTPVWSPEHVGSRLSVTDTPKG